MGKSIGMLNGILYYHLTYNTNGSGSLFFTGPIMLLFAALAEWIMGNFFAFIVSYISNDKKNLIVGVRWLFSG